MPTPRPAHPLSTIDLVVDHCEMVHEFEIPPGMSNKEIRRMHRDRHESGGVDSHRHPSIRNGADG